MFWILPPNEVLQSPSTISSVLVVGILMPIVKILLLRMFSMAPLFKFPPNGSQEEYKLAIIRKVTTMKETFLERKR
jgi:phenylpyruvate tautomerase PptA (4-oxalocrotonate tautomerase family)